MKKYIISLAVMLTAALGTVALTSCGDDNDGVGISTKDPTAAKKGVITYTVKPTEDMLKYLDLKLVYTDNQGGSQTIDVNSTTVTLTQEVTKFPVTFNIYYTNAVKTGITLPENQDIDVVESVSGNVAVTTNWDPYSVSMSASSVHTLTGPTNLSDFCTNIPNLSQYSATIAADGTITRNSTY